MYIHVYQRKSLIELYWRNTNIKISNETASREVIKYALFDLGAIQNWKRSNSHIGEYFLNPYTYIKINNFNPFTIIQSTYTYIIFEW